MSGRVWEVLEPEKGTDLLAALRRPKNEAVLYAAAYEAAVEIERLRAALRSSFAKACPYCARGWPISDGDDGVPRNGQYHMQECQYSPGKFGGGFVKCKCADERALLVEQTEDKP